MKHIKVSINVPSGDRRDILIALLSDAGYDGIEEQDDIIHAYISEDAYEQHIVAELIGPANETFQVEVVEYRNWNQVWEDSIQPLIVADFCTIVTHFHNVAVHTPHKITITPKMSFGTGHHATTQLMMMGMRGIDFEGKKVLDFGTGTGVLAILAAQMGAKEITAIDNDDWSVENASENIVRNDCPYIDVLKASIEDLPEAGYDIVLANINRHILLQYMTDLSNRLPSGGILLMSGLLPADERIISEAAISAGFDVGRVNEQSGWISIFCMKS